MNMLVLTNRLPTRGPTNGTPDRLPIAEQGAELADLGLVLMDMSFRTIAFDRGAATILSDLQGPGMQHAPSFSIPPEIQKAIRDSRLGDLPDVKVRLHMGSRDYKCHAFLVKSHSDSLPHEMVVLHLERDSSPADRVTDLSAEYQLTAREQEALRGIAMGLTSKELADRMEISPGTVKSFLRMIMIKLGVRTRGAILAKLIEYNGAK
jgi:DNA-binding CsgD family transcriptional regulator